MALEADDEKLSTSMSIEVHKQKCTDCGQQPPPTETNYTLISARHGWRLSRSIDANGHKVMQWRCPDCWRKHRTTK